MGKRPIDALLIQEEMSRLQGRANETQAGITLYKTLQESLTEQMDAIRELFEVARV